MNDLTMLASYHHSYGGGWGNWLAHVTVSSLVHSLIYGVVFKVLHRLTTGEAVVLVVLGCLFMWSRSRDRRGWRILGSGVQRVLALAFARLRRG